MHLTHNFAKGMTNVFVDHIIPVAFSTHSLMKRLTANSFTLSDMVVYSIIFSLSIRLINFTINNSTN